MTPERYQKLGQLFDEALERAPAERADFLRDASGNDSELRQEVEKLLANYVASEEFLARPALEVAAELYAESHPAETSASGRQLSHYQILSLLGAGGMGQVYLARDTRLTRQVALKLLPVRFLQNPDRLRRFEREALAASALNHPNILTIYEFGSEGDTHFLATEYVQGENLRQRITRGQFTSREILDITIQIASALQAAHQTRIIHRDIKPDNIMLRHDGIVKVLDFGLAKLVEQIQSDEGSPLPTPQSSLTQQGAILGTVAYMSPEQARGGTLDERSDLFSLGVVLYEMLTGRQPFTGPTVNHTIVAILEQDPPPLAAAGQVVPAGLESILRRLLAKKPEARYDNAASVLSDLKQLVKRLEREEEVQFATPVAHEVEAATQIIQLKTNEQLGDVTMQLPPDDSLLHAVDLAHVLFCDIVGYSLLPIDRQTQVMQTLQTLVRQTDNYKWADAKGQLVRLPAGDGMALAFLQDVTAPVRCAVDLTRALRTHPDIQLRIGIHSGPVYQSADINAQRNVVGSGINLAQRVMDCGEAGHILMSRNVAEVLQQITHWQPLLHDLGEHEVKHGVKVHLYNLYAEDVGNPLVPAKLGTVQAARETPPATVQSAPAILPAAAKSPRRKIIWWLVGALLALGVISIPVWQSFRARSVNPVTPATALPERSLSYFLTVQRYRNGKPYQSEFQSSGREIFEPGWQFKLHVTSPQEGYLYLLNETPTGDYVLLFPIPSRNNGSAYLTASERFQTGAYLFDAQPGTERFRLVWAAHPVLELEAVRGVVNPTDKGQIRNPVQIQAVRAFVQQHSISPTESVRDKQNQQTNVRGTGEVLVALVELEHR